MNMIYYIWKVQEIQQQKELIKEFKKPVGY